MIGVFCFTFDSLQVNHWLRWYIAAVMGIYHELYQVSSRWA